MKRNLGCLIALLALVGTMLTWNIAKAQQAGEILPGSEARAFALLAAVQRCVGFGYTTEGRDGCITEYAERYSWWIIDAKKGE